MGNEAISSFIINALSKGDYPDEIILYLCEKHSLIWQAAETLVKNVQVENEQVIAKKTIPTPFHNRASDFHRRDHSGRVWMLNYHLGIFADPDQSHKYP
jgi:hypothetical protein